MPASIPSPVGGAGNILLVEEYGALAIAIGSALKKFAPSHQTHVVPTLAAAESVAIEQRPELLVIDFDPPQAGAVAFFERMKSALPQSRVLLIAAGMSRDVLASLPLGTAFRFVEKPFDLAAFGVAVGAALARDPSSGDGTLRDLTLADLLPLLCAAGATLVIAVDAARGRHGEIHLAHGQIVHATAPRRAGVDALEEMLRWDAPRFSEVERPLHTERGIQQPWGTLLVELLQSLRPVVTQPQKAPRKRNTAQPAKRLVVIDDTALLLTFVEEVLSTADEVLEIRTAESGLAGLSLVREVQPDAVLLDFSLPDITGDEICRQLLEDPTTSEIPIVMMSGHVLEMNRTAGRYENVVSTIAKPFLSHAMIDVVQKVLTAPPPRRKKVAIPDPEPPEPTAPEPAAPASAIPSRPAEDEQTPQPTASRVDPRGQERPQPPIEISPALPTRPEPQASAESEPAPNAEPLPRFEIPAPERAPAIPPLRVLPRESPLPVEVPFTAPPAPPPSSHQPIDKTIPFDPSTTAPMAPVRIAAASQNAVVLGLSLEVLAMRFSAALQMGAIRARPSSWTVSLHVHPNALPGVRLPEAGFQLGKVELDARGHIDAVRLVPTSGTLMRAPAREVFPVGDIAILPGDGDKAMELLPTGVAPMTMQLFASFELVGVELSPTFGIGALVLKSRGGDIRVTLQPASGSGATFKTAQVLLDRSARIAEILLDAVA